MPKPTHIVYPVIPNSTEEKCGILQFGGMQWFICHAISACTELHVDTF